MTISISHLTRTDAGYSLTTSGHIPGAIITIGLGTGGPLIITASQAGNGSDSDTLPPAPSGAIMVPGTGWTGPTDRPAVQGNPLANGYIQAENAIARWNVVPYQTFSGNFNVGVVAFHSSENSMVRFGVSGGTFMPVQAMSANTQTANAVGVGVNTDVTGKGVYSGGIVEYWATLRASDFADGPIEVRSIAYPTVGTPRVLNSLFLVADAGGSIAAAATTKFVDSVNGDNDNNGSSGSPFQTFQKAQEYFVAHPSEISYGCIRCYAGSYTVEFDGQFGSVINSDSWLTVQPADGVTRADVIFTAANALSHMQKMHWKNIKFRPTSAGVATFFDCYDSGNSEVWVDGCDYAGPVTYGEDGTKPFATSGGDYLAIYITDSQFDNIRNGLAFATLARNVLIGRVLEFAVTATVGLLANVYCHQISSTFPVTNITVDASDNKVVSMTGYLAKSAIIAQTSSDGYADRYASYLSSPTEPPYEVVIGSTRYRVTNKIGTKLQLEISPGEVNTNLGSGFVDSWAHSDFYQILPVLTNAILYGCNAPNNRTGGGLGLSTGQNAVADYAVVKSIVESPGAGFSFACPTVNLYVLDSDFLTDSNWLPDSPQAFTATDVYLDNSTFGVESANFRTVPGVTFR